MSEGTLTAQELLSALGSRVGIRDMQFNDENVCRLILDKTMVIDIEFVPATNLLQVSCSVGNDPGTDVAVLRKLLAANLYGQGTGGSVLGLDEDTGEVLLTRSFDLAGTDAARFVDHVEQFVGYADTWAETLMEDGDAEPAAIDTSSVDAEFGGAIRV